MITKRDPTQPFLWSRYRDLLSDAAIKALDEGWQGVFHRIVLRLLPIECMEEKFSRNTGRPTKELYSVCGFLLMMEYFGWTLQQGRLSYMVDLGVQYTLDIEKNAVELSERTLQYGVLVQKAASVQDCTTFSEAGTLSCQRPLPGTGSVSAGTLRTQ